MLVAGVRQAEATGVAAAWSPRPPHLARGRDRGGVKASLSSLPIQKEKERSTEGNIRERSEN